ncbi:hypothetical protein MNQ96_18595 [Sphingopyxis granuli]|uniref:LEM-3-like GIY-YIG domain-containing protein n=1 Tax=Sphingopyxis granuli TaxID=267128 RepID=UPI001F5307FD|nr:hypothetical protein [Sphingopyxis granuli]UNK79501.1 hypothetical protein MNQ96_18595 [Sphingopyxis granuli]
MKEEIRMISDKILQAEDCRFSEEVCEKIGNYVYRLIDPRNDETFYVGRGRNNRVFDHVKGVLLPQNEDEDESVSLGDKLDRIREIQNSGHNVLYVIHRHEIPSDEATAEVEAALIDAYAGLTNIQRGYGSCDRGPTTPDELKRKYGLPEFPPNPDDKLILICINSIENKRDINSVYDKVRYCWRINEKRAKAADYVIAVVRGVSVGVFKPEKWMEATHENFPEFKNASDESIRRRGFVGRKADEVWDKYVGDNGMRLTNPALRHVQYPLRYWPTDKKN